MYIFSSHNVDVNLLPETHFSQRSTFVYVCQKQNETEHNPKIQIHQHVGKMYYIYTQHKTHSCLFMIPHLPHSLLSELSFAVVFYFNINKNRTNPLIVGGLIFGKCPRCLFVCVCVFDLVYYWHIFISKRAKT